jgi:hypothetical protein
MTTENDSKKPVAGMVSVRRFGSGADAGFALFVVVAAALVPLHHREKPLGNSWDPAEYAQGVRRNRR